MKKIFNILILAIFFLSSCKNGDWDFPNYEVKSVYFAYQSPIRTITLGEDIFDTTLDNEFKCQIVATTGGVYSNNDDVTIGIAVKNSLTTGLKYSAPNSGNVIAMPNNYYTLSSDKIVIPKGKITGGVTVQLTDAFFADPNAIKTTYVIPVAMTSVQKADSILINKNYTLYAIKYINKWTGFYLRRGKDIVVGKNGNIALDGTINRRQKFVEKDEINKVNTKTLKIADFPVTFKGNGNTNINCNLLLNFDDNGNCTITAGGAGYTATGSGKFVKRGEKQSWGNKDRDALYLNYVVELNDMRVSSTDTLVLRDRGVAIETFTTTK